MEKIMQDSDYQYLQKIEKEFEQSKKIIQEMQIQLNELKHKNKIDSEPKKTRHMLHLLSFDCDWPNKRLSQNDGQWDYQVPDMQKDVERRVNQFISLINQPYLNLKVSPNIERNSNNTHTYYYFTVEYDLCL